MYKSHEMFTRLFLVWYFLPLYTFIGSDESSTGVMQMGDMFFDVQNGVTKCHNISRVLFHHAVLGVR